MLQLTSLCMEMRSIVVQRPVIHGDRHCDQKRYEYVGVTRVPCYTGICEGSVHFRVTLILEAPYTALEQSVLWQQKHTAFLVFGNEG